MNSIYIASSSPFAGKSLLSLLLCSRFKDEGRKVGYFKPLGLLPAKVGGTIVDEDALFIVKYLNLDVQPELISPVMRTPSFVDEFLKGKGRDFSEIIKKTFESVSRNKNVVVVGGSGFLTTGCLFKLTGIDIAKMLRTKVLLIVRYAEDITLVDESLIAQCLLKDNLGGIVINKVPEGSIEHISQKVLPYLEKQNIPVFGIIPQDRILASVSVRELVEHLGGTVLCCEDKLDELVERFSIGAMSVESALRYFRQVPNKAVITGGDRSDIQLAALETSTKCIILTGNLHPNSLILAKAQELCVPIIIVADDTLTTVERMESTLSRMRVREEKKIKEAKDVFERSIDFKKLYSAFEIK
ncbi:AAA domain-containing protein [Candidatus Micrarchaeota archaeon CG06_land_8_20_14_3_00_50_6]|nr:MAG: AAA domain-containing protein [Candidatus Micrarchaeota archaeon CG06_land_8_20_14_3_00_50_6]